MRHPQEKLFRHLILYGGMNDFLQMKDFFKLIGPSNVAKIKQIKVEIDAQLVGRAPNLLIATGRQLNQVSRN